MAGSVSDNAITAEDFEGTPSFTSIGGGAGAGKELVTFYQGTASGSRKVTSTSSAGFRVDDLNSPLASKYTDKESIPSPSFFHGIHIIDNNVWMVKCFLSDGQDLNSQGLRVGVIRSGVESFTHLHDDGTFPHRLIGKYPSRTSWLVSPWHVGNYMDPESTGWLGDTGNGGIPYVTARSGGIAITPPFTEYAITAGLATGAAKSENLFLDSIDFSDGLYLVGGTESPDSPATIQDFIDYDQGTIGNRLGHASELDGILYYYGRMVIGRTSPLNSPANSIQATYFNDSNKVIVFPNSRTIPGWASIQIDLNDPGTEITFNNFIVKGIGKAVRTFEFNATEESASPEGDLNVALNKIRIPDDIATAYESGDIVEYLRHENADGVIAGLPIGSYSPEQGNLRYSYCAISAVGSQSYIRLYEMTDATMLNAINDNFIGDRVLTVGSPEATTGELHFFRHGADIRPDIRAEAVTSSPSGTFTINGGSYENIRLVSLNEKCTINDASFISLTRLDQNGASLNSVIFLTPFIITHPNQFRGFEAVPGAGKDLDIHALINSDDPSKIQNCTFEYLNDNSNDGHAIRITVPGTYTFTGNTFTGAWGADDTDTAMIFNDSGGQVTLNITGGGTTPTVKNAANSPENTTTINNNVNVTITNLKVDTEVRVYLAEDFTSPLNTTQLAGVEDVASPTEFTFSAAAGTIVDIVIHNIDYVLPPNNRIKNFTVPTTDTSFPVSQIIDRTFNNP